MYDSSTQKYLDSLLSQQSKSLFSPEFQELISESWEAAIDLGYDHITTVHFLIADCESKTPNSIFNFGFRSGNEYLHFKKEYTIKKNEDVLVRLNDILPLTKEAEIAIRLALAEAVERKQAMMYPCHFFIGALKSKESILNDCFKHDPNVLNKLISYYEKLGELEKGRLTEEQASTRYTGPNKNNDGFFKKISKLWRK